jgi:hypothetical protein
MKTLKRRLMNNDEAYIDHLEGQNKALVAKLDELSKLIGDSSLLTENGSQKLCSILMGAEAGS